MLHWHSFHFRAFSAQPSSAHTFPCGCIWQEKEGVVGGLTTFGLLFFFSAIVHLLIKSPSRGEIKLPQTVAWKALP